MSSQKLPETPKRIAETAPSETAPNEPNLARIVGLIGILLVALGFAVIFTNEIFGPRLLTKPWGFVAIAIGMVGVADACGPRRRFSDSPGLWRCWVTFC